MVARKAVVITAGGEFEELPAGDTLLGASGGMQTPGAVFGDGNSPSSVPINVPVFISVPYSGTITNWTLIADAACSVTIEVWKKASGIPTVADKISASASPQLSSSSYGSSSTLTGWTVTVNAGDVFGFVITSLSGTPDQITLTLGVA